MSRYRNDEAGRHLAACLRVWPASVPAHLLAALAARRAGRLDDAQRHLDECRKAAGADAPDDVALEWGALRAEMGDLSPVEESLQARRSAARPTPRSSGGARPGLPPDVPHARGAHLPGPLAAVRAGQRPRVLPSRRGPPPGRGRQPGATSTAASSSWTRTTTRPAGCSPALVQVGRFDEAAGHLELMLAKTPGDPELTVWLARARRDLGRPDEATRLLDDVLQSHPDDGPALRERGRVALHAGQFAEAEPWLRRAALRAAERFRHALGAAPGAAGTGEDRRGEGGRRRAQELKDRAEQISAIESRRMAERPHDARLHAELGELLLEMGQTESGERWLLMRCGSTPSCPPPTPPWRDTTPPPATPPPPTTAPGCPALIFVFV